ncbi:MAG: hypothetical protein MK081_13425 [Flavobacteriales bacterium]|nr:hypothetical protein [Flavobacteriales bacterium]
MNYHTELLTSNTAAVVDVVDLRADEDTPVFDTTDFGQRAMDEMMAEELPYFAMLDGLTVSDLQAGNA